MRPLMAAKNTIAMKKEKKNMCNSFDSNDNLTVISDSNYSYICFSFHKKFPLTLANVDL